MASWAPLFYTLGIFFIVTVLFALLIGITAKKIDFGERLFNWKDRKTIIPRGPFRRKAVSAISGPEEFESTKAKRKGKSKRAKSSIPSPKPSSSSWAEDVEPVKDEKYYSEMADRVTLAGREHAPKYDDEAKEIEEELEMAKPPEREVEKMEEVEMMEEGSYAGMADDETSGEAAELESFEGFSRDLSIMIPKNMCLDEVFRLKITLIREEKYDDKVSMKEITVDKESAEYFSLNVTKLGEKVIEATTRIYGLEQGTLIVRPIAVGHAAALAPQQRIVYFHPDLDEIVIEFFITPTKWSKDLESNLRIEFEQNYRVLQIIDIPIKIYKRKMEAIFGINISKWQTITLFVYSAFGTISGLLSFFWDSVVPFMKNLLGIT